VVFKLTDTLVKRVKEADEKRELTYHEFQHTQKLASIGRLAAGVAHEINNPMAIINEKAGLMKDLVAYEDDFQNKEKFLGLTDSILKSVERCRAITHRLLGFARRMEVQLVELDLNELIQETLGFLEKEALYRNIELIINLANNLPRISSDRGQIQQVFLNIINNALAAVEDEGEIVITSWEEDTDTVGVSIRDNGRGMSEKTLKSIFDPFFSTKKEKGTGLGLAITYGIVKKMGGNIKVESKQGEGSTFTVFLPKNAKIGPGE
jgi:two-component system NtrC family sensor kinase